MSGENRTIPFTAAQRSSIRITALLMLPVGLIMLAAGLKEGIDLLPVLRLALVMPLVFGLKSLGVLIELALGVCLILAALALLSAARAGTVDALLRGLRALCVVAVVKATLLLLLAGGALLAFMMPMVL